MHPQEILPRACRENDGFLHGSMLSLQNGLLFVKGRGHGFLIKRFGRALRRTWPPGFHAFQARHSHAALPDVSNPWERLSMTVSDMYIAKVGMDKSS